MGLILFTISIFLCLIAIFLAAILVYSYVKKESFVENLQNAIAQIRETFSE